MIDSAGNTIYTEPVINYLEGNLRRVSVEIYKDTAPGDATIYLVGELNPAYYQPAGQGGTSNTLTPDPPPATIIV